MVKLFFLKSILSLKGRCQLGFTLIEMVVVIGILLLIAGAITSLFFVSLRSSTGTIILNDVKQNGDYTLSVMERMIRNARTIKDIQTVCDNTNKNSITIVNPDNQETTFSCPSGSGQIASQSAYLNSPQTPISNCSFSCYFTPPNPAVVKISFTIGKSAGSASRPEETVSLNYSTSVVVRNTGF